MVRFRAVQDDGQGWALMKALVINDLQGVRTNSPAIVIPEPTRKTCEESIKGTHKLSLYRHPERSEALRRLHRFVILNRAKRSRRIYEGYSVLNHTKKNYGFLLRQ